MDKYNYLWFLIKNNVKVTCHSDLVKFMCSDWISDSIVIYTYLVFIRWLQGGVACSSWTLVLHNYRRYRTPVLQQLETYWSVVVVRRLVLKQGSLVRWGGYFHRDRYLFGAIQYIHNFITISNSTELLHNITIVSSGAPISGETYNLTCTVEANVPPTVQWLYSSNGTTVTNGSDITVGTERANGSTTTLTLSFSPLHTSHGGQYTCQSSTDTPPSTVTAKRNVTVQGGYAIRM